MTAVSGSPTKRARFRAADMVRAMRAYAKGAGVPVDAVSVRILADGEIVVGNGKVEPVSNPWDKS